MSSAVGNRPYRGHRFMVGTVSNCAYTVRLETAPTGPGEHIELPNYFLKPHQTAPTGLD